MQALFTFNAIAAAAIVLGVISDALGIAAISAFSAVVINIIGLWKLNVKTDIVATRIETVGTKTDVVAEKVASVGTQVDGQLAEWKRQTAAMLGELKSKVASLETKLDVEREKATTLAAVKTEVPSAPVPVAVSSPNPLPVTTTTPEAPLGDAK